MLDGTPTDLPIDGPDGAEPVLAGFAALLRSGA
jgi:hypothetical protein